MFMCMRQERGSSQRHARERVCIGRPHFVCARRAATVPRRRVGRQVSEGQEHRKPLGWARDGQPNRQRRCVQHGWSSGKHLIKHASSRNLPTSCSECCRRFSYVEHDYLLSNSCRINSSRHSGHGGRAAERAHPGVLAAKVSDFVSNILKWARA